MKRILLLSIATLSLTSLHASVPAPTKKIGFAQMQGRRKTMEDEHCVLSTTIDGKQVEFYGVYDGHAGDRAAKYAAAQLHENIFNSSHFPGNPVQACIDGCEVTDTQILANTYHDGSCVIAALIYDGTLYAINLGDSRAVVCRDGKTIALSSDHKPDRPDEHRRITDAGGFVAVYGVPRVGGRLAISRALGDAGLKAPHVPKSWVSATPEVRVHTIAVDDDFLILACDGVWDVLSNEQAVKIVKDALEAEDNLDKAAQKLRDAAYNKGSGDNITAMVVPLTI